MNLTRRAYDTWTAITRIGVLALAMIYRPDPGVVRRVFPMLAEPSASTVRNLVTAVLAGGVAMVFLWLERRYVLVDGLTVADHERRYPRARMSRETRKGLLILGAALVAVPVSIFVALLLASRH